MAEGGTVNVKYVDADLSDDAALMIANLFLTWGQEEGVIPSDRPAVEEGEEAIFACVDKPFENGVVGGAVFYQPDTHPGMLFLDVLWVSPDCRRRGIGGELIRRVCAIAAERGCEKVEFGTLVSNQAMQQLGHSLGFSDFALMMDCPIGGGGRA
jgi:ribosomal protein S18 acetylase RimI-like enzyme